MRGVWCDVASAAKTRRKAADSVRVSSAHQTHVNWTDLCCCPHLVTENKTQKGVQWFSDRILTRRSCTFNWRGDMQNNRAPTVSPRAAPTAGPVRADVVNSRPVEKSCKGRSGGISWYKSQQNGSRIRLGSIRCGAAAIEPSELHLLGGLFPHLVWGSLTPHTAGLLNTDRFTGDKCTKRPDSRPSEETWLSGGS